MTRPSQKGRVGLLLLLLAGLVLAGYARREFRSYGSDLQAVRMEQFEGLGALFALTSEWGEAGYLRLGIRPTSQNGLLVEEVSEIRLAAPGGFVQQAREQLDQVLDSAMVVESFLFVLESEGQTVRVVGTRVHPDSMDISVRTGGEVDQRTIEVPSNVVVGSGLWPRLALSGALEEGAKYHLLELDPVSVRVRDMEIRVGSPERRVLVDPDLGETQSDTVDVFPVTQSISGLESTVEVDSRGLPVSASLPLGLRLERTSIAHVQELRSGWADGVVAGTGGIGEDLISRSAIQVGATLSSPRTLKRLRLRVGGVPVPEDAHGGVQKVLDGDVVEIRVPDWPTESPRFDAVLPDSLRPYLEPGFFVESDRPAIRQTAQDIVGDVPDRASRALRIASWVHRSVEKAYVASVPSAVEVLENLRGDCNEHTVLSVALFRAAGIPARAASGLVYLDGRFYFHAWPEVWVSDAWLPLDPTFGEGPAGAARLRLAIGTDRMMSVAAMVGRVSLDLLDEELVR